MTTMELVEDRFYADLKGEMPSGQNPRSMSKSKNASGTAFARVSNAAATSSAPSTSQDWRNLPQPARDPKTGGVEPHQREGDRNLPMAPPDPPQLEAA
jgi:hypothetical protein